MRAGIRELVAMGSLPPEATATEEEVAAFQAVIEAIVETAYDTPITDEEAQALISCFGPDTCFELGWALVHLIEQSPTPFPKEKPDDVAPEMVKILWDRVQNYFAQN